MTEIIIVRHGEAEHLLQGMVGGWSDSSLTDHGRAQARKTGEKLKDTLFGKEIHFYCSDLARAKETAEIIGTKIGQEPIVRAELRELSNGLAANKTKEEAENLKIEMSEPILDWIPYPEAESWNMLHNRVQTFMEGISIDKFTTTLIVTHGNTANSIIHWWLEFNKEMIARISFDIEPCSITRLTFTEWNGNKTISKLNDTGHLQ